MFVDVARITKAHGVRGEVKAHPINMDVSDLRFLSNKNELYLKQNENERVLYEIENVKFQPKLLILKLKDVDSIDEANALRSALISFERDKMPELNECEVYVADYIGLDVLSEEGEKLGKIVEYYSTKANDVFVVKTSLGTETHLPFVEDLFFEADFENKCVFIKHSEGYFE